MLYYVTLRIKGSQKALQVGTCTHRERNFYRTKAQQLAKYHGKTVTCTFVPCEEVFEYYPGAEITQAKGG